MQHYYVGYCIIHIKRFCRCPNIFLSKRIIWVNTHSIQYIQIFCIDGHEATFYWNVIKHRREGSYNNIHYIPRTNKIIKAIWQTKHDYKHFLHHIGHGYCHGPLITVLDRIRNIIEIYGLFLQVFIRSFNWALHERRILLTK